MATGWPARALRALLLLFLWSWPASAQQPPDAVALDALAASPKPSIFKGKGALPYPGPASATLGQGTLPERLALVIGVNAYDPNSRMPLETLANAENDAQDVHDELGKAGFRTWLLKGADRAATRNAILNKLSAMLAKAAESEKSLGRPPVLLFYFAGHGLSYDGVDYIVPSDFDPSYADDIPAMAISLAEIRKRLEWASASLYIVMSDACRTPLDTSIVRRPGSDEIVKIRSEHSTTGVLIDNRTVSSNDASGDNDAVIAFATGATKTASDIGPRGNNGAFASALLEVLRDARQSAEKRDQDGRISDGSATDLVDVLKKAGSLLQSDSKQRSEMLVGATTFLLYPTVRTYFEDEKRWRTKNQYAAVVLQIPSGAVVNLESQMSRLYYCIARDYLKEASHYNYFSFSARKMKRKYEESKGSCDLSPVLNPRLEKAPDGNFRKNESSSLDVLRFPFAMDGSRIAWAVEGAPTSTEPSKETSLTVGNVLDAEGMSREAKQELAGFDRDLRIDDLGVAAFATSVKTDPGLRAGDVGTVRDGDLVQILALGQTSAGGPTLQIIMRNGKRGYIEQKAVNNGRLALAYPVATGPDGPLYDRDLVKQLVRGSLVSDAVVQFKASSYDRALGTAARAAVELQRTVNAAVKQAVLIPRLAAVPDDAALQVLGDADVRVAMTLLPLDRDLRRRIASVGGASVSASDAIDLSVVKRPAAVTAEPSSSCVKAAEEVRKSGHSLRVSAYIQYGSADRQASRETAIRQALRDAAFSLPDSQLVDAAPNEDEIRVCDDHPWSAGLAAARLLAACGMGDFVQKRLPACRKTNRNAAIEIWLGQRSLIDTLEIGELTKRFGGPDRRLASDRLAKIYPADKSKVVEAVTSAVRPDGPEAYRINVYVARTLAAIRGGWQGNPAQKAAIESLKSKADYGADETFRQNVERALKNYKGPDA